ncbi:hypothetical protein RKD27_000142 [Streptomyces sp. SAI-126]|uniref:hypothetical protein n=1 Tax=Streptomyces sp. SAI-126 TaxID=3377732 RepID=UPI000F4F7C63
MYAFRSSCARRYSSVPSASCILASQTKSPATRAEHGPRLQRRIVGLAAGPRQTVRSPQTSCWSAWQ